MGALFGGGDSGASSQPPPPPAPPPAAVPPTYADPSVQAGRVAAQARQRAAAATGVGLNTILSSGGSVTAGANAGAKALLGQ